MLKTHSSVTRYAFQKRGQESSFNVRIVTQLLLLYSEIRKTTNDVTDPFDSNYSEEIVYSRERNEKLIQFARLKSDYSTKQL